MDVQGGLQYTRFLHENLAATLSVKVLSAGANIVTIDGLSSSGTSMQHSAIVSLPLGIRWDPQPGDLRMRPVKLYIAAGPGPVWGAHTGGSIGKSGLFAGTRVATTFGGFVGGGVDVLVGRRWSIGVSGGYNWVADFPDTLGTRKNFSGADVGISIGWMWGKTHAQ